MVVWMVLGEYSYFSVNILVVLLFSFPCLKLIFIDMLLFVHFYQQKLMQAFVENYFSLY
jgi:hypothetical protein